jgi:hypothetical protein
MKLPRLSTFPLHKPFQREEPTTPLSEAGLRLVADIYTDQARVLGSAIVIAGNLILTAKHVLDGLFSTIQMEPAAQIEHHLSAFQLLPGPRYIIWDIAGGMLDPTSDLALFQLATNPGMSNPEIPISWRQPRVNPFAPDIGERIVAFNESSRRGACQFGIGGESGSIKRTKNQLDSKNIACPFFHSRHHSPLVNWIYYRIR